MSAKLVALNKAEKRLRGKGVRKACWLLTETRKGWKLSLEVDRGKSGGESFPLRGHYFNDTIVAMEALDRLNIVIVHLKEQK